MRNILFCLIFICSTQALAAPLCFQQEYNLPKGQVFASEQEYNDIKVRWQQQDPGFGNPLSLVKAYAIYRQEKDYAQKLGSDKRAHCYLGCRIAQETSYKTADYVGWLKEERDLGDCNLKSRYDEEDYRATVQGAQFGENQSEASSCVRACKQVYR